MKRAASADIDSN